MTDETQQPIDSFEADNPDALLSSAVPSSIDDVESKTDEPSESDYESEETSTESSSSNESSSEKEEETDEYGNEKPSISKTYTEDEVNERINAAVRERLSRLERNGQAEQQVQKQTKDNFEYDENSAQTWQEQLEGFVKQTVSKMHTEQAEHVRRTQEQQAQLEFEQKFIKGMDRFKDYKEVVKQEHMTDAMVLATRSMADPAAFVYAAVKRAPEDIKRIASLKDPYAQMVEMGKLEERMRKTKTGTSAPRPLSRTKDDASINHKSDKEPSVDDLIAQSERKRQAELRNARRR